MPVKVTHIQDGWDKDVSISYICSLKNRMIKYNT